MFLKTRLFVYVRSLSPEITRYSCEFQTPVCLFTFSLVVVLNKEAYDMAGVDDTVSLTTTNKGKPSLHVNGYFYRLDRTYAKSKTWRCTKNGCRAWCRTMFTDGYV